MALTAEQYSDLASAHERAAADPFVPAAQRASFAKKAEFYRLAAKLSAKLAAKKSASGQTGVPLKPVLTRTDRKLAQTDQEASAHLQALQLLALRWRLSQLASNPLPLPTRSPPVARSEH